MHRGALGAHRPCRVPRLAPDRRPWPPRAGPADLRPALQRSSSPPGAGAATARPARPADRPLPGGPRHRVSTRPARRFASRVPASCMNDFTHPTGAEPGRDASAAVSPAARTSPAKPDGVAAERAQPARPDPPSGPAAWRPGVAAPRPGGAGRGVQHPWLPNSAPAAQATPSPGRTVDTAVVGSCVDHRGLMVLRRTRSSAPTTDFLAPTGR